MPKYNYKARDREGRSIQGTLEVENEGIIAKKLEKMGYILVSAEEQKKSAMDVDLFARFRKVPLKEIVQFSVQLSTLIKAGVPLVPSIEVLGEQRKDLMFRGILETIVKDIRGGTTFSEALQKHPKAFSTLYISMIRAGEATGELDTILISLSSFLETESQNRSKIKSALSYPMVMMSISLLVVIFLMTVVLPSFVGIFEGAGVMLPLPTRIVIAISNFLVHKWYIVIGVIGVAVYGAREYIKTDKGRYYFDLMKFKVPVFGQLLLKSGVARFTRTFGTLIEANVPILQSLNIVKDVVGNFALSAVIENISGSVRQGGSISEQIELSGIFPHMVSKMVSVGENSGALDTMLIKVAEFYESEIEEEIKGLTSLLEPLLMVGMGLVIGVIVLAVMLPMFDMMQVAKG